jgi:hypothetical protein
MRTQTARFRCLVRTLNTRFTPLPLLAVAVFAWVPAETLAISNGFIENRGQVDERVLYYATGPRATVFITREGLVFDLRAEVPDGEGAGDPRGRDNPDRAPFPEDQPSICGCAVYLRFECANPSPRIAVKDELPARYNYFLGNDPVRWQTDVPAYGEVVYGDLWPGVDLVFRAFSGALVYEVVKAGVDAVPAARFRYEGIEAVDDRGSEVWLETSVGALVETRSDDGHGRFLWALASEDGGSDGEGLEAPDDPSALLWSTFLSGSSGDYGHAIALDPSGNPVLTGETYSPDFPATPGAYDTSYNGGYEDAFIAKLSSTGSTLLWSTFLGGSSPDVSTDLALDAAGNPVLTGYTSSTDFPTTSGAYDGSRNGLHDAFVTKLSSTGSELFLSSFLGGTLGDTGYALALDSTGNVVVTGATASTDFPTTPGTYDTSFNGNVDVFVTKLSSTGSALLWSTFLGGSNADWAHALALDFSGNPVLTGYTPSADFPTTPGAYDASSNGTNDVFVTKLSSTGSALLWSTFLGDSLRDEGLDIALDSSGNPVLTGWTESSNFPTTPGAYDTSYNGAVDVFVTKLSSTGSELLWSTFLGGSDGDEGSTLALDSSECPVLTGFTGSIDFPTTPGAFDTSYNDGADVFVAKLSSTGNTLVWSTFLGGSDFDWGRALALDSSEDPVVTGFTLSPDFPTTPGAYDTSPDEDEGAAAFVAKLATSLVVAVGSDGPPVEDLVHRATTTPGVWVFPNPSARTATIEYALGRAEAVDLAVHDLRGHRVRLLESGPGEPGSHRADWDGRDDRGAVVGSGVYFVKLRTASGGSTGKLIVLK